MCRAKSMASENAHELDGLSRCGAIHDEMSPSSAVACDVEDAEIGWDFVAREASWRVGAGLKRRYGVRELCRSPEVSAVYFRIRTKSFSASTARRTFQRVVVRPASEIASSPILLRRRRPLGRPASTGSARRCAHALGAFTRFLDDGRICLTNNAAGVVKLLETIENCRGYSPSFCHKAAPAGGTP
jgi:hypothetical protein